MALQVWLPLNGTLENKGLSNVTVTNNGATVDNNGKIGKCYLTDGSHYFTVSSQPWMSMKPDYKFSLFIWVKGTTTWLIAASGWELILRDSYACIGISGYQLYPARHNATYSSTTWYHLGFTWDGSTGKLRLYINGEEKAVSDVPSSANFNVASSLKLTYAGPVCINDLRIYNHCLSPKEVKEISKGLILHYKLDGNDIGISIPRNGGLIPDGVELYDYILSSGTLYIDTEVFLINGNILLVELEGNYVNTYSTLDLTFGWDYGGLIGRLNNTGWMLSSSAVTSNISTTIKTNITLTIDTVNHKSKCVYKNSGGSETTQRDNSSIMTYATVGYPLFRAKNKLNFYGSSTAFRLYSCKIHRDETLVRNMLPCTYLGEPGMWDTVENKFYRNQGTGLFTLGNKITLKEYEYLLSSGTLYINTEVSNFDIGDIEFNYKFKYNSWNAGWDTILGTHGYYIIFRRNSTSSVMLYYTQSSAATSVSHSLALDVVYDSKISVINNQSTIIVNGTTYSGGNCTRTPNNNLPLFIYASNVSGTALHFSKSSLYYLQISKNNQLVRDFIPVSYNGTPGLWDKVEWKFYANAGSGSFTLGPEKTIQQDAPIFYDSSGYCNHGSITGTLTINSDSPRYTNSIAFDSTLYISLPSPTADIQSISIWAKWNSTPSTSVIFVDYNSGLALGVYTTGIVLSSTNASKSYIYPKSGIAANTWYHFVIVKTGTTTRDLYINGTKQTPTSSSDYWTYSVNELQLGRRSSTANGIVGKLSDFRVYATALSEDDIKELYNTSAFVTNNGVFAEYELYEDNLSDVKKRGLLETANFYENGAESGYALDTDKTRVASNYIISEDFIEI